MAQKPLKKLGKSLRVKANVANKHGKGGISKSGAIDFCSMRLPLFS